MHSAKNQLIIPENAACACPGEVLIYNCTVIDTMSGATIWNGSAFDCASNNVILRHDNSFSEGTSRICSGGAIVGQSLDVNGTCYTSQLNVTVDSTFNNKTVMCSESINSLMQPIKKSLIKVAGIAP